MMRFAPSSRLKAESSVLFATIRAAVIRRVPVADLRKRLKTSNGTRQCISASAGGSGRLFDAILEYQCHVTSTQL